MRFAISIPQLVPDGTFDPTRLRDYLARAESFGFHSAWTQEHLLGSAPILAPLEVMTFAATCTERLRLGCAVLLALYTIRSTSPKAEQMERLATEVISEMGND